MARKLKHSKIKNTGILFELLTRQITADVLAGKSTKSVKIVKKYFNFIVLPPLLISTQAVFALIFFHFHRRSPSAVDLFPF